MKIVCYARMKHQVFGMEQFIAGLARHGIHSEKKLPTEYYASDLAVFWGHRFTTIIERQKAKGFHYLVMERGYIGDRFYWTSLGFDGLNGRARFPSIDDAGQRWRDKFAAYVKPARLKLGNKALVMGQVPGDASIQGIDFMLWAKNICRDLKLKDFEVSFRPHPGYPKARVDGVPTVSGELSTALDAHDLIVTYNSNSGVDAVLNGNYTVAIDDGSMVKDVASRNLDRFIHEDRVPWFRKMAYTQWAPEEIESGAAWEALRTVICG